MHARSSTTSSSGAATVVSAPSTVVSAPSPATVVVVVSPVATVVGLVVVEAATVVELATLVVVAPTTVVVVPFCVVATVVELDGVEDCEGAVVGAVVSAAGNTRPCAPSLVPMTASFGGCFSCTSNTSPPMSTRDQ
jgi:hypothetical protein